MGLEDTDWLWVGPVEKSGLKKRRTFNQYEELVTYVGGRFKREQFYIDGTYRAASRVLYEQFVGPIPAHLAIRRIKYHGHDADCINPFCMKLRPRSLLAELQREIVQAHDLDEDGVPVFSDEELAEETAEELVSYWNSFTPDQFSAWLTNRLRPSDIPEHHAALAHIQDRDLIQAVERILRNIR
ncbi:hypothetical protein P409_00430 [Inquilinus limosus MP06]|uniref:Uncharacterized protein n=1 Tax=Inquilinus limosus MP06 TaxID=1398085 RepID=A0A0A0DGM0_9PROT|nr:hypothetical protein P409_00430 [Inquilinus limosus MP06]